MGWLRDRIVGEFRHIVGRLDDPTGRGGSPRDPGVLGLEGVTQAANVDSGALFQSSGGSALGYAMTAGAALSFGVVPLVHAPPAHADAVDAVIDQIFSPFMDAATNSLDWDTVLTPAAWDGFLDPGHWDAVFAGLGAGSVETTDLTGWFEQLVYVPMHSAVETWIRSDVGQQVDGFVNTVLGSYAIGDGAAGSADHPDGGAGGWLFGDGGAGWDSTVLGVGGGAGGTAGLFGDGGIGGAGGAGAGGGTGGAGGWLLGMGGDGGDGGDGAVGGMGGHGGDGGWLFGVGGHGGAGGDGGDGGHGGDGGSAAGLIGSGGAGGDAGDSGIDGAAAGLPALGGAGGTGSMLGTHGAVGHYGSGALPSPVVDGFSTAGSWIVDGDGRVVILHGLDHMYKLPPYEPSAVGFGDDDAAFLAANGFNSVYLGMMWAALEPEPGVFNQAYLDSIAQTVQTLADHGIVTVIGMNQDLYGTPIGGEGAPDWAVQTGGLPNFDLGFPNSYFFNPAQMYAWDRFWANAPAPDGVGLENHYAQAWEYAADYFKGDSSVVGFDLMPEPSAGSQWLSSVLGNPYFDAQQLTPFYNQVASAVRAVDPNTTFYIQPNVTFDLGLPTHLGTVNDPNTVFQFDYFCLTSLLFGSNFLCDQLNEMAIANAMAYAGAHQIPAEVGGFGATDNVEVLNSMLRAMAAHQIGWAEWAYTGKVSTVT